MATIAQIRTSIATVINAALSGVEAEARAGNQTAGTVAIVFPQPGGFKAAACDKYELQFVIEIHVPVSEGLVQAQNSLDALIDPLAATGITAALEANETLSGTVDYVSVDLFTAYQFGQLDDKETLTARLPVSVGI